VCVCVYVCMYVCVGGMRKYMCKYMCCMRIHFGLRTSCAFIILAVIFFLLGMVGVGQAGAERSMGGFI
jgi:hypothetical protein